MKILRPLVLGAAIAASLGTIAFAAAPQTLTIKMAALNNSGETGTAVLTQVADGVQVVVNLDNAPKDTPQPTHIHAGTCDNINKAPEYGLSNTVNGKGTSTVKGVKLADLMNGKYAINVHKSGAEIGTYAACGNIK